MRIDEAVKVITGECEFDDMAAFTVPMPLFCDAEETTSKAIANIEGEKP